ncbi:uncharacterized protein LOC132592872 [Zootoca vivipara]|uniref:uncharacterized protein LOC132592872 n=1 Tax=Zootoca vivipara TaxID=8524 RepID=UPI00293BFD72|nr:uncharacterized protein LOC132592872 [Zootoca vivipara]
MSLSNQPSAPLSEYSQLCKGKSTEGISEGFHCMEAQKDFGKTEFAWQRTEGKLNEIGLNVNSGGQLKDGLVKSSQGFTDEDKLCFFEGKLDKELKAAPKDKRGETETLQGKKCPMAPLGHLESWALISEAFPPAEGGLGGVGAAGSHSGQAESTRSPARMGQHEAITDQEKAAGKKVAEAKCHQGQPGSDPKKYAGEPETSVWNPSFSPVLTSNLGCPEATRKTEGPPAYSMIGVVNDSYVQSRFAPSPALPKLGPPTTTVELAQDDFRSSCFNNLHDMEDERFSTEVGEKQGSDSDCGFLNRGAHQRKAMRRAMSESSHLSVPPALNLADKYPEPLAREDLLGSLVSPSGSLSQNTSPMTRKPSAPMKRSATVSEEQTSARSLGSAQNNAEPPSLIVNQEHPSLPMEEPSARKREEWDASDSAVKRELVSPGLYHSKLEQIPEIGGHGKGGRVEEEAAAAAAAKAEKSHVVNEPSCLGSPRSGRIQEMEPSRAASVPGSREIEVSGVLSAPSPQQGDGPRDGMLLNFLSPPLGSRQTRDEGKRLDRLWVGERTTPPASPEMDTACCVAGRTMGRGCVENLG